MRALIVLAMAVPFGSPPTAPPAPKPWTEMSVAGLTLLVGPADVTVGTGGIVSTSPVEVAGGKGTLTLKLSLVRDVTVSVKDADVQEVAGLFDLPAAVRSKLVGKIGSVVLTIKGDALTLTATDFRMPGAPVSRIEATADLKTRAYKAKIFVFGGLATAEGKLPTGD